MGRQERVLLIVLFILLSIMVAMAGSIELIAHWVVAHV